MRKKQSLADWINEALVDPDKGGPCTAISLAHMLGVHPQEVHTKRVVAGQTIVPRDLADIFQRKAESYCQDLQGAQTFKLLAFYGKNEAEATHPFMINGAFDLGGNVTEAPTPTGEKMQSMRHQEMMVQMAYRAIAQNQESLIRQNQMLADRCETLQRENHDAYDIVRDIIQRQVTEQHEQRMEALRFERATAERKKWLSFAPALINQLLGREIFPQATADTALVESICDSMSAEQVEKLAGALPPELWGPLANRMNAHMDKKHREAEAMKQLAGVSKAEDELAD